MQNNQSISSINLSDFCFVVPLKAVGNLNIKTGQISSASWFLNMMRFDAAILYLLTLEKVPVRNGSPFCLDIDTFAQGVSSIMDDNDNSGATYFILTMPSPPIIRGVGRLMQLEDICSRMEWAMGNSPQPTHPGTT